MARLTASYGHKIYDINRFFGVNENPDSDINLKAGESAEMRNFKVTPEGALQLRPGTKTLMTLSDAPVRALWTGYVGGLDCVVAVCGGKLWSLDLDAKTASELGALDTWGDVTLFGYEEKLYIMTGSSYKVWDGEMLEDVIGYRPLVTVSAVPSGGGTELERVNMLNGLRRIWFSPEGSSTVFQLPETDLASIDYVIDRVAGEDFVPSTDYTVNASEGTVTFASAPASSTNTIEIGYTVSSSLRAEIEAMRFAETYNGVNDNRVFLYGDGSNNTYYSDLDYNGRARADYFPDLNVVHIGDANTPVTGMVRHYDRLLAFKQDSAYSLSYDTITLPDGSVTAGFYIRTVNKNIGNCAMGQARLVVNHPRTLDGRSVYEWLPTSTSGNITGDQRNAKLISERIEQTLSEFLLSDTRTYVDKYDHEYYLIYGGTALVHNYDADAWYIYSEFTPSSLLSLDGELYGGTPNGRILHISRSYQSDDGAAIDAYWRSGAMTFGAGWARKYLSAVCLTMKPEPYAGVNLTLVTNDKSDFETKRISYSLSTFSGASFKHWSFGTSRQPQTRRVRLRARKFVYLRLILSSRTDWSTATVLSANLKVRLIGDVK